MCITIYIYWKELIKDNVGAQMCLPLKLSISLKIVAIS